MITETEQKALQLAKKVFEHFIHNEPAAEQYWRFPEAGIIKPANDGGKGKKQRVKPALRLPAERVCLELFPLQGTNAVQMMEGSLKIE